MELTPWSLDEHGNIRDRRFVPQGERSYDIQAIWTHHHEIARRVALGQSNVEIAEALGCTPQTVSNFRNSQMGRTKIAELNSQMDEEAVDISRRIQEFAPVALDLLEQIISGQHREASIALRAKYAHAHLARAGFGEVKKVAAVTTHFTREDIEAIKQRAKDAARESGILAEYKDVSEKPSS